MKLNRKFLIFTLSAITIFFISFVFVASKQPKQFSTRFYIWNQLWTPQVLQAIDKWKQKVETFHILAVSYNKQLKAKRIDLDWQSLEHLKNLTFVIRINGNKLPEIQSILNEIKFLNEQNSKIKVSRLEIDFDAPTSQLKYYGDWLKRLKEQSQLELGITAIPTWLESKDLEEVLNSLDYYVLQVHSVLSPEKGLFDPNLALKWVKKYSKLSNTKFFVALPNYWYQAGLDDDNDIQYLAAEQKEIVSSQKYRDVLANPKHIAQAIRKIEEQQFNQMQGWIWFRLPTSNDKRIFADSTINHLMEKDIDWSKQSISLSQEPIGQTSTNYDFWVSNTTEVDLVAHTQWDVPVGCEFQHLIDGVISSIDKIYFEYAQIIKPGQRKRIGWAKCSNFK